MYLPPDVEGAEFARRVFLSQERNNLRRRGEETKGDDARTKAQKQTSKEDNKNDMQHKEHSATAPNGNSKLPHPPWAHSFHARLLTGFATLVVCLVEPSPPSCCFRWSASSSLRFTSCLVTFCAIQSVCHSLVVSFTLLVSFTSCAICVPSTRQHQHPLASKHSLVLRAPSIRLFYYPPPSASCATPIDSLDRSPPPLQLPWHLNRFSSCLEPINTFGS